MLTCTVFFGAALLFSMEPLVGRLLTPYFGGAAHVWLTCLMFFQAMLLLGYLYAHLFARKLGPWHLLFLLIPLVSLPLRIGANPNPGAPLPAILVTLGLLCGTPVYCTLNHSRGRSDMAGQFLGGTKEEPTPFTPLQTQVRSSRFLDTLF